LIIIALTDVLPIIYLSVILWLSVLFLLWKFATGNDVFFRSRVRLWGLGLFVLVSFWAGFYYLILTEDRQQHLLILLFSIISFDTGAYFFGTWFGKHKLAPAISPSKSIEGIVGGILSTGIVVGLLCVYWGYSGEKLVWLIVISVLTGLISALGDLLESAMKRYAGVKDSGRILPGHGGVLDRIDSYTAGTPFFALALFLLGHS
jgi:phosphatidate cytidylyltransferase